MNTYQPEKLSMWDRLFNRYKIVPIDKGSETWQCKHVIDGYPVGDFTQYNRNYVEYHKIDRLTGAYTIKKEYLN